MRCSKKQSLRGRHFEISRLIKHILRFPFVLLSGTDDTKVPVLSYRNGITAEYTAQLQPLFCVLPVRFDVVDLERTNFSVEKISKKS